MSKNTTIYLVHMFFYIQLNRFILIVVVIPCSVAEVTLTHTIPDTKSVVKINDQSSGSRILLNIGRTMVNVHVISPDGSTTKVSVNNLSVRFHISGISSFGSIHSSFYVCV